jgi:UDP:flavonoid glycosyltransferase YjiC (YdhE family)
VRILVSSTAGYGHVLPMLPLARAAVAAGHDVLWATGADACEVVGAAGIAATPAGLTNAKVAPLRAAARRAAAGLAPEEIATRVFPLLFGAGRTEPMLTALLPVAREWRPDLLVHENGELAAPLVATLLGAPNVVQAYGGAIPARILADGGEHVARLWLQYGLELPPYAGCYQHLYLDICPPALQTVSMSHIGDIQAARPVTYDGEDVPDLAAALPEDDGRPLVYVTLGTVSNRVDLMTGLLHMLAGLGVRLLVTVGPGVDPAALGPQPAGVRVWQWVPQAIVLPHCAAVVSHGGSGTLLATAALGLPQLCLPQAADQFRNATGLVRARAGLALHPDHASTQAVGAAVREVLNSVELQEGAGRVRDEIVAMPPPEQVLDTLVELVSRGPEPRTGPT